MSRKILYFCDICEEEIPHQQVRHIEVMTCAKFEAIELDICEKCYEEALKGVNANIIYPEKRQFGSVLKLWFSKRKIKNDESIETLISKEKNILINKESVKK